VTRSEHGADEQRVAHALAASADETLASPLSGLASPGREPDKGRDLSAVERRAALVPASLAGLKMISFRFQRAIGDRLGLNMLVSLNRSGW
jgi:hypothetical protein